MSAHDDCSLVVVFFFVFFFFFQAEDGIRDADVTGVQTCALPIFLRWLLVAWGWVALPHPVRYPRVMMTRRQPAVRGMPAVTVLYCPMAPVQSFWKSWSMHVHAAPPFMPRWPVLA